MVCPCRACDEDIFRNRIRTGRSGPLENQGRGKMAAADSRGRCARRAGLAFSWHTLTVHSNDRAILPLPFPGNGITACGADHTVGTLRGTVHTPARYTTAGSGVGKGHSMGYGAAVRFVS